MHAVVVLHGLGSFFHHPNGLVGVFPLRAPLGRDAGSIDSLATSLPCPPPAVTSD